MYKLIIQILTGTFKWKLSYIGIVFQKAISLHLMQNNDKVWWNDKSTENILIPMSASPYKNLYLLLHKSVPSLELKGSSCLHTWNWNVHISFLDTLLHIPKSDIQKSIYTYIFVFISMCSYVFMNIHIYTNIYTYMWTWTYIWTIR